MSYTRCLFAKFAHDLNVQPMFPLSSFSFSHVVADMWGLQIRNTISKRVFIVHDSSNA